MNETISSTSTLSLPETDPIVHALLILAFLLHAVFMNLVLGGTLVTVATDVLGALLGNKYYWQLATTLANWLPGFLGAAVMLGVIPLVIVQLLYGPVFSPSLNLLSGVGMVAFCALVLGTFGLYGYKHWREWLPRRSGLYLGLGFLCALLFLSVAMVFVMVSVLMLNPDQWENIRHTGFWSVLNLPSLLPRFNHLVLAAVAGMGMFVVWYGFFGVAYGQASEEEEPKERYARWVTRYGVAWTLVGTLPQIVIGPWLFLSLPAVVRADLASGESFGSLAFFVGLTTALLSLVLLNAALMAPQVRGLAIGGTLNLVITVCLMIVVRHAVRVSWLSQHDPSALLPIQGQWTVMLIVGATIFIGLGLTMLLVRKIPREYV